MTSVIVKTSDEIPVAFRKARSEKLTESLLSSLEISEVQGIFVWSS